MITRGLVIDGHWLAKILAGEKTWEIRSRRNTRSGRIALCEKGGAILGTAVIGPSIPLTRRQFAQTRSWHRVSARQLLHIYKDRRIHAWPLMSVRKLRRPIPYQNPGGGSWVRLSANNVPDFHRLR